MRIWKACPSDILPLARPRLLNPPQQCHQLGTKYPDAQEYGGQHLIQTSVVRDAQDSPCFLGLRGGVQSQILSSLPLGLLHPHFSAIYFSSAQSTGAAETLPWASSIHSILHLVPLPCDLCSQLST